MRWPKNVADALAGQTVASKLNGSGGSLYVKLALRLVCEGLQRNANFMPNQ